MVIKKSKLLILLFAAVWLLVIGLGFFVIYRYEFSPNVAANAPSKWPVSSSIVLSDRFPTLVLLAHPKCPCTRATIRELASIMTKCKDKVKTYVLFYKPSIVSDKWAETDLWELAKKIPGITILFDNNGTEARIFKSISSGQTLLYNSHGELLFSGGITGSRGHLGSNAGKEAVVSYIINGSAKHKNTLVFGCSIIPDSK